MSDSAAPWIAVHQASLSFIISPSCSNSCALSQSCHPTISSSVTPFSSCPQSFPASGSFPVRWLFASGGQSIRASASASVLQMNIKGWFPLGNLQALQPQRKYESSSIHSQKIKKRKSTHFTQCSTIVLLGRTHKSMSLSWTLQLMSDPFFNSWFIALNYSFLPDL